MLEELDQHPGLLFVVATLLPLAAFTVLLLAGALRSFLRSQKTAGSLRESLFELLGGDAPGRGPAWIATGAIMLSCVGCVIGAFQFLSEHHEMHGKVTDNDKTIRKLATDEAKKKEPKKEAKPAAAKAANKEHEHGEDHDDKIHELHEENEKLEKDFEKRWSDSVIWASLYYRDADPNKRPRHIKDVESGTALQLGYRIDHLSAIMFVMVSFIASLIHLFSIGYMSDELHQSVTDHEVHTDHGHLHRRGRFGRFFLFLSLFCFSMLNLVLADNLFQIFLSWELVGICSYLLIGFYYERTSASNAANKAFITNRIGDAGFIIGLLILWTSLGTLNFQEIFARLRVPSHDAHHAIREANRIMLADMTDTPTSAGKTQLVLKAPGEPGEFALIYPRQMELEPGRAGHFDYRGPGAKVYAYDHPGPQQYGLIPYWMLVVAGLGVFLGCVGKSAQFPLQVWLPDAMEGPTPVSALIHAATMVAAGVYLVGRAYPLFTPEVLLTIAYVGGITLFVAASIAVVMTDIKKVLAYSTVSQLGYMMLGLGVGGWAAGLFHLVTHAFFKALMFLASGSVIYGCHHQQDMLKMGGLYPKMKITALTMLMGVLAIAGIPLFSGWYSKDAIVAAAMGFGVSRPQHMLLFLLPLATAGITTFYMFRMWFMTFTGKPRDEDVHEHAAESPWIMTVPLILLAFFSVVVAWPVPVQDGAFAPHELLNAEGSWLEHQMHHAQPGSVMADFSGHLHMPYEKARAYETDAGLLALAMVAIGLAFAFIVYYWNVLDPADARESFPGVHRFLTNKWYFDELYSVMLVRPALVVAGWCKNFDLKAIDGLIHGIARLGVRTAKGSGRFDNGIVDGLANLLARVSWSVGAGLRNLQTGFLRSYVLFLALAAAGIWIVLWALLSAATGAGK
jgi:NADH-quinone oxidoreductase subunit L